MNIHARMRRAIDNALCSSDNEADDLSRFAEVDDDSLISFNPGGRPDAPNEVTADSEYGPGIARLLEVYQEVSKTSLPDSYVGYVDLHEGEHIYAARRLGATAIRVGIGVFSTYYAGRSGGYYVQPFVSEENFVTTKLKAALITAYPTEPSPGDHEDIRALGYAGIPDLAERAIVRNMARGKGADFYPVPLSFSGTDLGRRFAEAGLAHELTFPVQTADDSDVA